MRPSLLNIHRRLKPFVWLLLAVMVPALSPHLMQGAVLCIGDGHIAVESAQAAHHDGGVAPSAEVLKIATVDASASERPVLRDMQRRISSEAPCQDVPLYLARTGDTCHRAVTVSAPDVDGLAAGLPIASLNGNAAAPDPHPVVSLDETTALSRPLSTVVLLI